MVVLAAFLAAAAPTSIEFHRRHEDSPRRALANRHFPDGFLAGRFCGRGDLSRVDDTGIVSVWHLDGRSCVYAAVWPGAQRQFRARGKRAGSRAQLVYPTTIYGFASAALVIYTRTIWPIVGIHALIDLASWLQAGTTLKTTGVTFGDVFITVVGGVLAIGYGVLLLILAKRSQRGLSIQ